MAEPALTVIRANGAWFRFDARVLWRYRDLLWLYIRRDITLRYRQTVLGPLWLLLQPLAMTGILTVTIRAVAGLSTGGQPAPLFFMSALAMWGYFSLVVPWIGRVFIENEYLFSKVYFPRLIIPISISAAAVIGLAVQLAMLGVLVLAYIVLGGRPAPGPLDLIVGAALLVVAIVQLMALSLGAGLVIASSTAKYRDLSNATPFLLQAGLFLTPVIYPLSAIPERFRAVVCLLNPLAAISDLWRRAILGVGVLTPGEWALSALSTALVLAVGVLAFQRVERTVSDTI